MSEYDSSMGTSTEILTRDCTMRGYSSRRIAVWCVLATIGLLPASGCGNLEEHPVTIEESDQLRELAERPDQIDPADLPPILRVLHAWNADDPEPTIERWLAVVRIAPDSELRIAEISDEAFQLLRPAERDAKLQAIVDRVERFRAISDFIRERAMELALADDRSTAHTLLEQLVRWGEANADKELITVVRLSGRAIAANAAYDLGLIEAMDEDDS